MQNHLGVYLIKGVTMNFNHKFRPLDSFVIRRIEKQLKKENVAVKPKWHKNFRYCIYKTIDTDIVIAILFHTKTKRFYVGCSILNDADTPNEIVGKTIALNRIALYTDFQHAVAVSSRYTIKHTTSTDNTLSNG